MDRAELKPPRRARLGVAIVVVLIHVAAIVGLIQAFAPNVTGAIVEGVTSAFSVTVTTPPPQPEPTPEPEPAKAPEPDAGEAAPPGKKATPREVVAPEPKVVIAEKPAPRASSTGSADRSGARDAGQGTGAGGAGTGTGAGGAGSGPGGGGGGVATKAVKVAGDINSARDYPRDTRGLRLGDDVIVALTIGTDGRVKACRVHRASRDPEADRITCRLATQRFRFEPAKDANGNPVVSEFGWQQRWFTPGTE